MNFVVFHLFLLLILLQNGLTFDANVLVSVGTPDTIVKRALPITPNYLKNPQFPHGISRGQRSMGNQGNNNGHPALQQVASSDELVLKVRVAESAERDFIEVELSKSALTLENLVELVCEELQVDPDDVVKIRKLPNTIVRKDKDVLRLQEYQELELVMKKTSYAVLLQNLLY